MKDLKTAMDRVVHESPLHGPVLVEELMRLLEDEAKREYDVRQFLGAGPTKLEQAEAALRTAEQTWDSERSQHNIDWNKQSAALAAMTKERDEASARADRWTINEGFARKAVEDLKAELAAIKAAPSDEELIQPLKFADLCRRYLDQEEGVWVGEGAIGRVGAPYLIILANSYRAEKAKRMAAEADLNETWFDPDHGPDAWRRPTAEAYARVCVLYRKAQERLKLCDDGTPDARGKFRVIEAEGRTTQLLKALLDIRDKWIPALRRDSLEGDKVLCHAGGIAHLIAVSAPEHEHPAAPKTIADLCHKCRNGEFVWRGEREWCHGGAIGPGVRCEASDLRDAHYGTKRQAPPR